MPERRPSTRRPAEPGQPETGAAGPGPAGTPTPRPPVSPPAGAADRSRASSTLAPHPYPPASPPGDARREAADRPANVVVHDAAYAYRDGGFRLRVPHLRIEPGERVVVVGPSGSGKTTLVHLLTGILAPSAGEVKVLGFRLDRLSAAERRELRLLRLGLVFQQFELLEYLDVLDNVLLPYRLSRVLRHDPAVRDRARALLAGAGLGERTRRFPAQLSQGERQRVAVCRALVTEPAIVFGDEPTANLDPENRDRIAEILFRYAERAGAPLVVVSHDRELAARFERVIDMGAPA